MEIVQFSVFLERLRVTLKEMGMEKAFQLLSRAIGMSVNLQMNERVKNMFCA